MTDDVKAKEYHARYKAREDYKSEGCFHNPYKRGSFESICYTSEAQKIRFEYDASI